MRSRIKLAVTIVPFPVRAAEAAGVALGSLRNLRVTANLTVDAMVKAFAAIYGGGVVYTSDGGDLARFSSHFPTVRLLSV